MFYVLADGVCKHFGERISEMKNMSSKCHRIVKRWVCACVCVCQKIIFRRLLVQLKQKTNEISDTAWDLNEISDTAWDFHGPWPPCRWTMVWLSFFDNFSQDSLFKVENNLLEKILHGICIELSKWHGSSSHRWPSKKVIWYWHFKNSMLSIFAILVKMCNSLKICKQIKCFTVSQSLCLLPKCNKYEIKLILWYYIIMLCLGIRTSSARGSRQNDKLGRSRSRQIYISRTLSIITCRCFLSI